MPIHTTILTVNPATAAPAQFKRAAEILQGGGLVAFPTETVYGLGADATSENAAKAVYTAKGRPSDNPLIIHVATPADAEPYAVTNPIYYKLAEQFMPGPLTVILPKKDTIPYSVTGGLETVAVRCPSHPVANALILAAGIPIAAPSANLSGRPSPTCAAHVIKDLSGRVDMIIDGGACEFGLESTIIALNGERATLLRPGAVTYDALCCVCGSVDVAPAVTELLGKDERPLSPGMKYKHYAPRADLILLEGDFCDVLEYLKEQAKAPDVGILCYDEEISALQHCSHLLPIGKHDDLAKQAQMLFSALREADEHPEIKTLFAHLPPKTGLGLALYNRCIRAAAHTVQKVTKGS